MLIQRSILLLTLTFALGVAAAQTRDERTFADATAVLEDLLALPATGFSPELLRQAHGVLVVPNTVRGGLFLGGRRGRGVLVRRWASGEWSNPSFVTLTGGSIGWQIGAQSADVVLVLTSERAATRLSNGGLTLGGDVSVSVGYGSQDSAGAVSPSAAVHAFAISRGLFAGAAFEGARLSIDHDRNLAFYGAHGYALAPQDAQTPSAARRFLLRLGEGGSRYPGVSAKGELSTSEPETGGLSEEEATLYPLQP
jgi:lipid-binding SYLF domain-containing protein